MDLTELQSSSPSLSPLNLKFESQVCIYEKIIIQKFNIGPLAQPSLSAELQVLVIFVIF